MSALHFQWVGGGTGNWGRPVRVDSQTLKVAYEGLLGNRIVFDDGPTTYLRTRFVGVDVIGVDGHFPTEAGFGEIEGLDADGDWLLGHVDWEGPAEGSEGEGALKFTSGTGSGVFEFTSGTGKWEGAAGTMNGKLWFIFEEWDASAPPTFPLIRPVRVYAVLEGDGELNAPNLGH